METAGEILETKTGRSDVGVYTYMSPKETWNVTSHVIVTPGETLTIDSQLSSFHGKELHEFVKSHGKEKNELIVTHAHPDHFGGLGEMEDITAYAFPEVSDTIDREGKTLLRRASSYMPTVEVADDVPTPTNVLVDEGEFHIGNLKAVVVKTERAEAESQTVIAFPELKIMVIQDLVYPGHTFLRKDLNEWIRTLELLTISPYYDTYLIGHGKPVTYSYVKEYIGYLRHVRELLGKHNNYDDFKRSLITKYPDYQMEGVLDMNEEALYPNN